MKTFNIDAYQMATLLLINGAIVELLENGISKEVIEELDFLQPRLYDIFAKIDNDE